MTHRKQKQKTDKTDISSNEGFCQPCGSDTLASASGDVCSDDSDGEKESEDQLSLPPVERNICPKDVSTIDDDDDSIFIVGTHGNKVTRLSNLENMNKLKVLTCRSCLIGSMDGIVENHSTLHKLELYDNHIQKLTNLEHLKNLVILDMSYNAVRDMKPVEVCVHLEELYLAQNKLRKIQGLKGLNKLRTLDLGANRIRVMDEVSDITSLKSLWLGKNKIEYIPDLSKLQSLRQLDIQSNRLTELGTGLLQLTGLEELYLACNNLQSLDGLPNSTDGPSLNTLDVTTNGISNTDSLSHLTQLEELWMSQNKVASLEDIMPLKSLPNLSCLYLEKSPIQSSLKSSYKSDILSVLPNLKQLDASLIA